MRSAYDARRTPSALRQNVFLSGGQDLFPGLPFGVSYFSPCVLNPRSFL